MVVSLPGLKCLNLNWASIAKVHISVPLPVSLPLCYDDQFITTISESLEWEKRSISSICVMCLDFIDMTEQDIREWRTREVDLKGLP